MIRMVNSFMCGLPPFQKTRNLKKTTQKSDVVFLPLILIHIIILPYCWYHSCISSNEGLALGWPHFEGRGLFRACWLTENGWTLADSRPNKSWWAEMKWNREKHCVSPKEPRSKLLIVSKLWGPEVRRRDGEGLTNRLGHKSLKVNPRVGPGFQKADKALPGAEILSQLPPFPFLPLSPHCCGRGNTSELKGLSNEWSGSYYLFYFHQILVILWRNLNVPVL